MASVFGALAGLSNLWSNGGLGFGHGFWIGLAGGAVGLLAGAIFAAVWLLPFGLRLDHKLAYRWSGWAILVHGFGFSVTYLVVVFILALGPWPDAIWLLFYVPIAVLFGLLAAAVARVVPGSFRIPTTSTQEVQGPAFSESGSS